MDDALGFLSLLLALTAAASKLLHGRQGGRTAGSSLRFLAAALTAGGMSVGFSAPLTRHLIANIEPIPMLGRLLANLCATFAAFCVVGMIAYSRPVHRRVVGHGLVLVSLVLAMTALAMIQNTVFTMTVAGINLEASPDLLYQVIYRGYVSACIIQFLILMMQFHDTRRRRPGMPIGLQILAGGGIVGLAQVIAEVAGPDKVSEPLAALCLAIMAIGTVWADWIESGRTAVTRLRSRWIFRALGPLWSRLYDVGRQMVLSVDPNTSVELLLYRRVIEIRDAQLALRPFVHPCIRRWAADLAREQDRGLPQIAVIIEAAELVSALDAYQAGRQHRHPHATAMDAPVQREASLLTEARSLVKVEAAITSSKLVRELRRRVLAGIPTAGDLKPR